VTDPALDLGLDDAGFYGQLCEAVGHVTVTSAHLEDAMRALYATMLGGGQPAWLLAAGQTFGTSLAACRELQKGLGWHPDGAQFAAVMNESGQLMIDRNDVVHGSWLRPSISDTPVVLSSKRWRYSMGGRCVSLDEVRQLGDRLRSVGDQVQQLTREGGCCAT
jgi:hypothetical protein